MPQFKMGLDMGALGDAWNRLTGSGDTVQEYVKSPEFTEKVLTGFRQKIAGQEPTALIDAQNGLVSKGWGPKTSAAYINGLLGHFDDAYQRQAINKARTENAPQQQYGAPEEPAPGPMATDNLKLSFGKPMGQSAPKPLNQNQAMDIMGPGKAWDNPSQVAAFGEMPQRQADLEADTGRKKTLARLEEMQANTVESLPNSGDYTPGPRALAQFPSLANMLPQREKPEDPLLEERRKLLEAQAGADSARAGYYNQRDRGGRGGAGGTGSETTTERVVPADKQLLAERTIAKTAEDRGVGRLAPADQARALRKIADDFGFELSGAPTLSESSSGILGIGAAPAKMTGDFGMRPKSTTRTTTKGAPAAVGQRQPAQAQSGQPVSYGGPMGGDKKQLDANTAAEYLKKAGGDKNKAREMARGDGYSF